MKVYKIRGALKNYEWGRIGVTSTVAQLYKSSFNDFIVEEIPYSELWMGTHISGPATIPSMKEMKLIDWVINHPECIGENITDCFGTSMGLPYLFKVLSVNKALSIQVHPDKATAAKLHKEFPEHYPDDNHKPEMAIALTDFEALCGFRTLQEIKEFLSTIPQLKDLIDDKNYEDFIKSPSEDKLKLIFTDLMICPPESFQPQLNQVVESFKQDVYTSVSCQAVKQIFLKIEAQYPGDIGCFCLFFFNYLKLKPGEAIFLAANEPHAYLSGDCIECMACSDNVVRAGLTPKFKDVTTLCEILTYKCRNGKENIFPSSTDSKDPFVKIYDPPVKEFVIDAINLPATCCTYSLKVVNSASILLIIEGTAVYKVDDQKDEMNRGTILFISACSAVTIEPKTNMLMYRSYCKK